MGDEVNPTGHERHAVLDRDPMEGLYVPIGQLTQALIDVDPAEGYYVPEGQLTQELDPVTLAYVPAVCLSTVWSRNHFS